MDEIIDYVMETPGNTNPNVLRGMLNNSGGNLPAVTSDENGDVLTVVDGKWAKAAPSGGGALVCNVNMQTLALDKTWQKIHDSAFALIVIQTAENSISRIVVSETTAENGEFYVNGYMGSTAYHWISTSADGYPVLDQG